MKTLKFEIQKRITQEQCTLNAIQSRPGFSAQTEEKYCEGRISGFNSVLTLIDEGAVIE